MPPVDDPESKQLQRPISKRHSVDPDYDQVALNSDDGFPASDAPSWTVINRIGSPARRTGSTTSGR
jgi:hypothetical protein